MFRISSQSRVTWVCHLSTRDWETVGHGIPLLANVQPAGEFLGEAYYRAGGVPAIIGELNRAGKIHTDAMTETLSTIGANCETSRTHVDPAGYPAALKIR